MTPEALATFRAALTRIPSGTSTGQSGARRYVTTRSSFNGGRSTKLVAEELGGGDYISLNFYDLKNGARLNPCEMPAEKVIAFVIGYRPDQDGTSSSNARPDAQVPCRVPSGITT